MGAYNFWMLIIIICFIFQDSSLVEARPLPSPLQQSDRSKIIASLGVVCKCCDDEHCAISWDGSCSNLRCLPWKVH
ncbi:hypothetical protein F511_10195 [Dorcoceras hygrometricum]|uniref:Uncharacterized protein n=1 Tax=Dorcoceras hygrometricum TaxID=472368 RepID=A0A2Z7D4X6_9LAMI|nr:hypothetical protein F511_10195 [Dorcoceras hygrometricum]